MSPPPPSPPSRPVPPAPTATTEQDDGTPPLESEPTAAPPLVVDPEAEIDASTLRFLSASFRALFLPWLIRLVLFTSAAKLVRFSAPYLLRAIGWTLRHLGTALSWLIRGLSWLALWAGLIGTAVWILAGCVGAIAYTALRLRPGWRVFKRQQPFASYGLRCAVQYGTAWLALRLVLRISARWCTRLVGFVALAIEAWSFVHRREAAASKETRRPVPVAAMPSHSPDDPQNPGTSSTAVRAEDQAAGSDFVASRAAPSSPNSNPTLDTDDPPIPSRDVDDDDEGANKDEAADRDLAEKWARQVREEMLRESLLAQGKKRRSTASTTAATSSGSQEHHGSIDEDIDSK